MTKFSRPTGTQDILPEDQVYWEHLTAHAAGLARRYGFGHIDVPIFEFTALFARGVGEGTDVVEKEMYTFKDKGNDELTLRPEFTAGIVRAYIEHGMHTLPQPVKLYSIGPAFRQERPQAGRFRQLHQFNAEVLGVADPLADLEIMMVAWDLYGGLGVQGLSFQLNSTGCPVCRPTYLAALKDYYAGHMDRICEDCKRRIDKNPLRVLDCKTAACQPVIEQAPKISDYLCEDCATHFGTLRTYLDDLGKHYTINHRLVRGLDYYTKTVFEVWAEGIGAQAAVCGGGRYDGLIQLLGGPATPAVGFAAGIERAVMVMKVQGIQPTAIPQPPIYVAFMGEATRLAGVRLLNGFRSGGLGAQMAMGGSLKSQLRQADKRGARLLFILGEDELSRGEVTLKDLSSGTQSAVALDAAVETARQILGG